MVTLPNKIHAGESLRVTVDAGYSSADGWQAKLRLSNVNSVYTVSGVADGDKHNLVAGSTVTTTWLPGTYLASVAVENSGTDERLILASQTIEIRPDLASQADQRLHVEIVLEALEKMLEGKATKDHSELTINGRTLKRLLPGELLAWRDKYKADLARIKRAERAARGELVGQIGVRF